MPDKSLDETPDYLGNIVDEQQNIVGTGFQVAPGLVITALHAVGPLALQDPKSQIGVVPFGAERPQPAVIQAAAGDLGLALLRCEEPFPSSVAGFLSSKSVARGTRADVLVASPMGRLTRVHGRWHETRISAGGVRRGHLLTPDFEPVPGTSGSPVVDARGRLVVGVLLDIAHGLPNGSGLTLRVALGEDVRQFLENIGSAGRPARPDQARLLYELSVVARHTGDLRGAGLLGRAAEHSKSAADPSSAAVALRSLGEIALRNGDTDTAERRYQRALTLYRELGWTRAVATCHEDLGKVTLLRGDFYATRRHADLAMSLFEQIGDVHGTAEIHALLGSASEGLGDFPDAEDRYRTARTIYDELGDVSGSVDACYHLARLAYRQHAYDHAVRYFDEALSLFERTGSPDLQAEGHMLLGLVAVERERYPEAWSHYRRAVDLYEAAGHTTGLANSYQQLGLLAYRQREYDSSDRYLQQALDLLREAGDQEGVAVTLGNLGVLSVVMGRPDRAVIYYVRALAVADPQRPSYAPLVARLEDLRHEVGPKAFGQLLQSAMPASHDGREALREKLRSTVSGSYDEWEDAVGRVGSDGPPETPPGPPGDESSKPGDDDDPQIINIWVGERENNPTVPLSARQRYTLVFRVGLPHPGNVAEGPREIPRSAIPREGLATTWVVSSTDVALSADSDDASGLKIGMADNGGTAQWMASFALTVPGRGDSEERRLAIVPLTEGRARIEVAVSIADDLYRWLTVDLAVLPPAAPPAVMPPAPIPTSASGAGQRRAITTTVMHGPPLRHVAPEPSADWQTPAARLNITLQPPQAHLGCERLGVDTMVRWAPNSALVEGQIRRVREALDRLRLAQQEYFNGIDPDEFATRLAAFRPSPDWAGQTPPGARWNRIATCPHLRRLAQEGYVLYQAVFDAGSEIREALDVLQPGDMLSLTWFPIAQHVAHVPWALMYREPPPAAGEPIDPENFLGIRLRLRYVSHQMPYLNRSLGSQDSLTRAHLMYWGRSSDDPVAAEKERHLDELMQWKPYVLPTCSPGKPEVVQFLDDPAPNPVGIVYIYCRSMAGDQDGPGFRFGNGPRDEDTVTLSEIGVGVIPDRPLVFANACGTSAGSPYVPNELEERFFLRGCSAFIGTECKVPITFAARFATAFFHFLYANDGKPTPAGEALTQARRFFWSEYGIVGGLFYSYVNDYHLYVAADTAVAALSKLRKES